MEQNSLRVTEFIRFGSLPHIQVIKNFSILFLLHFVSFYFINVDRWKKSHYDLKPKKL